MKHFKAAVITMLLLLSSEFICAQAVNDEGENQLIVTWDARYDLTNLPMPRLGSTKYDVIYYVNKDSVGINDQGLKKLMDIIAHSKAKTIRVMSTPLTDQVTLDSLPDHVQNAFISIINESWRRSRFVIIDSTAKPQHFEDKLLPDSGGTQTTQPKDKTEESGPRP